jgi:hypothetical protein
VKTSLPEQDLKHHKKNDLFSRVTRASSWSESERNPESWRHLKEWLQLTGDSCTEQLLSVSFFRDWNCFRRFQEGYIPRYWSNSWQSCFKQEVTHYVLRSTDSLILSAKGKSSLISARGLLAHQLTGTAIELTPVTIEADELSTSHKILCNILPSRRSLYADEIIGDCQSG